MMENGTLMLVPGAVCQKMQGTCGPVEGWELRKVGHFTLKARQLVDGGRYRPGCQRIYH
jgi:hypothetical protein